MTQEEMAHELDAAEGPKNPNTPWRHEKNVGEISRALSAIRSETNAKEWSLRNPVGPSSLPDPHYKKSFFLKKDQA